MQYNLNPLFKIVECFGDSLKNQLLNFEVYFVGGAIRDILLGRDNIVDIDIVTKNPHDILKTLKQNFNTTIIPLDTDFGVYRVFFHGHDVYIDISKLQGENIYEDLARRDFTINAIAVKWDDSGSKIIDPFNGNRDLETKKIRLISRKNLIDDPLRIVRAFRFYAELGFSIDEKTLEYIKQLSFLVSKSASERIKFELCKIFNASKSALCIEEMYKAGVLQEIFPFLRSYQGFYSGKRHIYDLWNHSLKTLEIIEEFLEKKSLPFQVEIDLLEKELEKELKVATALKISALFHDVGKILAFNEEKGRITYYKHEIYGSEYLSELFSEKKFSKNAVETIVKIVRYHMYPFHISMNKNEIKITPKIYLKLKNEIGELTPLIFNLFMADVISTSDDEETKQLIEVAKKIYNQYIEFYEKDRKIKPLLNGKEVMEILDLKQGPEVGKILQILREAEISGMIHSKDEAVNYLKRLYENKTF